MFAPAPGITRRELQRRALAVLTAPGFADSHPELIEELAALRERAPTRPRVFQSQVIAIMNSDRSARVREVKMPTLVLHGLDDQLIPVENGRQLAARIDGAKLVLFERCGHLPHLELPERCAGELHEFFG